MADVSITHPHGWPAGEARAAAQKVADQLTVEYDLASEWVGDVLHFERSGVSGRLHLRAQEAMLEISLSGLFKAFAPVIETKLAAKMKKVFG